ncbi:MULTISPECIES: carboxymuconolactone decarboxylase family protein [Nonomuraea]|uniref:Carboxymuconolactone decarboxylase family protein n=1 Tax=Nonomuraea ferruginea TaxID=46174 RepID=A0ABT4T851_9ACTN|nr:carboxymuconolactone decarboxylase family protein [Nonomuraea ferruginea]MDA0645290.1 carboxymuconolactone decarboxylase family protein [Nonomuraea ferruginea]
MTQRLNVAALAPEPYRAFLSVEKYLDGCGIPHATIGFMKLRASQINGCAFCVDMHNRELKKDGESDERIWSVAAWRETTFYTPAERAALALTEEATRLADHGKGVSDEVWQEAAEHYDDKQLASLVVAVAMINAWNRLAVTTRAVPGGGV